MFPLTGVAVQDYSTPDVGDRDEPLVGNGLSSVHLTASTLAVLVDAHLLDEHEDHRLKLVPDGLVDVVEFPLDILLRSSSLTITLYRSVAFSEYGIRG